MLFLLVAVGTPRASQSLSDSLQLAFRAAPEDLPTFDSTTTLIDYLKLGARDCCGLRASFYNWQAARSMAGFAGALDNPIASYQYGYSDFSEPLGGKKHRFGLMQPIPWFGTLGAKKRAAQRMADAAFQDFELERFMTRLDVKSAYFQYYLANRRFAITYASFELMKSYEVVVRTRYQAGLAGYAELARTQVELAELESMLQSMRDMISPTRVKLLSILNLPDTLSLPVPREIPTFSERLDRDSLIRLAVKASPELNGAMHEVEARRAELVVAKKEARPEFMLGVEYERSETINHSGITEKMNDYMLGLQMTIPLWFGKNRAMRRAAESQVQTTEYMLQEKRNDIVAMVAMTHFEYQDALRRMRLYRDGLIPKAQEALEVSFTAYKSGQTEFLMLLEAQQQLLQFELESERASVEAATKLAELEVLCGTEFDIILTKKSYMEENEQ